MYIDLLTKIKNAQAVKKESIKVPYSGNDERILEILKKNNFIGNFEKKGRGIKKIMSIDLKYADGKGAISGIKLFSTPSRHLYTGYKEIRLVRGGYGISVISTSEGVMTGADARKRKLGGEMFFQIW